MVVQLYTAVKLLYTIQVHTIACVIGPAAHNAIQLNLQGLVSKSNVMGKWCQSVV